MPLLRDLGAAWAVRSAAYSPRVRALILALDRLRWPWGEAILARGAVAKTFLRTTRLRRALAWAAAQLSTGRGRPHLARWLYAYHGRFIDRSALVEGRKPETLRHIVPIRREGRLAAAGRGRSSSDFVWGRRGGPGGSRSRAIACGPALSGKGWLTLRQITGGPVLHALSHVERYTEVVTVHPALPPLSANPVLDLEACSRELGRFLGDYFRRSREQCCSLAFPVKRSEVGLTYG